MIFTNFLKQAIFFVAFFYCLSTFSLFAQVPNQQQIIERQDAINQQRLEQHQKQIIQEREKAQTDKILDNQEIQEADKSQKQQDKGGCVDIKEISISGNNVIKSQFLEDKFTNKFKNRCLQKSDIKALQALITNYYIDQGYSNARIYFDLSLLLKQKKLSLLIFEGLTNEISLKDNDKLDSVLSWRKDTKLFSAFPFLKNKVFNLRDFEQGIDQINRLQSNSATIDIKPSNKAGYSDIFIENKINHQTNLSLALDNLGQEATGKHRKQISLSQDNLLGFYDNFYINYAQSNGGSESVKFSKSLYSNFSVPFGYWLLSYSYSQSNYLNTISGNFTTYKSSGHSRQSEYGLERTLRRDKMGKLSFKTALSLKSNKSFNNNSLIRSSSKDLSVFTNSLKYNTKYRLKTLTDLNSSAYFTLSYAKGTKLLNATKDPVDISSTEAHAQFNKLLLSFKNITPIASNLLYKFDFDSQYSFDSLYGSEKFSIGGPYSVRGFNENSISGDSGYFIKNEVEFRPFKKNYLNNITTSAFYDWGYVRDKYLIGDTNKGIMSGIGAAVKYSDKYLDASLTISHGVHSPKFIQNIYNQQKDQETIYFNITTNLGLL